METFDALKQKDVINLADGQKLGRTGDLELDLTCGRICALLIPEKSCCFGLIRPLRWYRVGWDAIRKMGKDVIFVDVRPDQCIIER